MSRKVLTFKSPSTASKDHPPINSLRELVREIERGEHFNPTGTLILSVREGENGEWEESVLVSGESMAQYSRVVGWIEILKHGMLHRMNED